MKVTRAWEQSPHRWGCDAEATSNPSPGPCLGQVPAAGGCYQRPRNRRADDECV